MGTDLITIRQALQVMPLPSADADFAAILAREEQRTAIAATLETANRSALLNALAAAGVTMLVVNYDGCGDSGQFGEWNATLADGKTVALADIETTECVDMAKVNYDLTVEHVFEPLEQAVETFCYDVLEHRHSGYENGDGGRGEFVFDVGAGTIRLTHDDAYTAYDTTEHEL